MPRPVTEAPRGARPAWNDWADLADKLRVAAAAAEDAEQAIGDIARRYGVRYAGRCLRVSHPTVLRWAQHGQLASQRLASLIPHAEATAANFGTPPAPRAV